LIKHQQEQQQQAQRTPFADSKKIMDATLCGGDTMMIDNGNSSGSSSSSDRSTITQQTAQG
jgi:hypothetical protein